MKKSNSNTRALLFAVFFAIFGTFLVSRLFAANSVNVVVDFASLAEQPDFHHYEDAHIRIQRNGGPADAQLLADIGTQYERSFVRIDQWKPTENGNLQTEHYRYGLGDSWIDDMNARGVSPWITQEIDLWKKGESDWFINPPLNEVDYQKYEDIWYDIVRYIKERAPQTEIVEMFNEPNCGCTSRVRKLTVEEHAELYRRNARVVNRINADLDLPSPGSPALISGGPSYIGVGFSENNQGNIDFHEFIDRVYAMSDFNEIKPSFISYHNFGQTQRPVYFQEIATVISDYLGDPKFNGDWDDVPIWNSAYNMASGDSNDSDPNPNESARWTASFAAAHHFMQESNVENVSMFAQSNYRFYESSVLLPEAQSSNHSISYYAPGKKTPVYNFFEFLSRVDGQRVAVSGGSLDANGRGFGTEAVRGSNEAWIMSWNYFYSGAATDTDPTYTLTGLSAAGIDDDETVEVRVYRIDRETSNIAHGDNSQDDLEQVDALTLPAGSSRQFSLQTTGFTTLLIELVGNNDGTGGGGQADSTAPDVSITNPEAHSTVSGQISLVANATDNISIERVEFLVDGELVGTDTTGTNDNFSVAYNTSVLTDGNHSFTARAFDQAGNNSTSSVVTLNVNNTPVSGSCDPSAVTAPAGNIATNYSYEVPNSGLNPIGTAVYSWPADSARTGNCSAEISSNDASASEVNQRYVMPVGVMPVTGGTQYDLSGWAKTTDVTGDVSIRVNFWSGDNGSTDFIGGTTSVSNKISGTNEWTLLSASNVTAPNNAEYARIELRMGGSGVAQFDDVSFVTVGGGSDSTPPTVAITTDSNEVANDGSFEIEVDANDNTAVDRIELQRTDNGTVLNTDSEAPYTVSLPYSLPNGDYTVRAVAYDVAGNETQSSPINVKVRLPDIDRNGVVSISDLVAVINKWGTNDVEVDLVDDGIVAIADLVFIINNWSN